MRTHLIRVALAVLCLGATASAEELSKQLTLTAPGTYLVVPIDYSPKGFQIPIGQDDGVQPGAVVYFHHPGDGYAPGGHLTITQTKPASSTGQVREGKLRSGDIAVWKQSDDTSSLPPALSGKVISVFAGGRIRLSYPSEQALIYPDQVLEGARGSLRITSVLAPGVADAALIGTSEFKKGAAILLPHRIRVVPSEAGLDLVSGPVWFKFKKPPLGEKLFTYWAGDVIKSWPEEGSLLPIIEAQMTLSNGRIVRVVIKPEDLGGCVIMNALDEATRAHAMEQFHEARVTEYENYLKRLEALRKLQQRRRR